MCKKNAHTNLLKGNEEKEGLLRQEEVVKLKETVMGIFFMLLPSLPPSPLSPLLPCLPLSPLSLPPLLLSVFVYVDRNLGTETLSFCVVFLFEKHFPLLKYSLEITGPNKQQLQILSCFDFVLISRSKKTPNGRLKTSPFTVPKTSSFHELKFC